MGNARCRGGVQQRGMCMQMAVGIEGAARHSCRFTACCQAAEQACFCMQCTSAAL
jgi:hypothetical protein